jgi:anti-anti-sigma factor
MNPQVIVSQEAGATLVRLEGRAGVEIAGELRQLLLQAGIPGPLLIDWDQAEHIESCVLQVLLAHRPVLHAQEKPLLVRADNPHIRQYLRLSDLADYFPVCEASAAGGTGKTIDA